MVDCCSAAAVASHLDVAVDEGLLYSFEHVEDGNFSMKCRSEPNSPSIHSICPCERYFSIFYGIKAFSSDHAAFISLFALVYICTDRNADCKKYYVHIMFIFTSDHSADCLLISSKQLHKVFFLKCSLIACCYCLELQYTCLLLLSKEGDPDLTVLGLLRYFGYERGPQVFCLGIDNLANFAYTNTLGDHYQKERNS